MGLADRLTRETDGLGGPVWPTLEIHVPIMISETHVQCGVASNDKKAANSSRFTDPLVIQSSARRGLFGLVGLG